MPDTLHVRCSRSEARQAISSAVAAVAGRGDSNGAGDVALAVGVEALSIIRESFIAKSRGGTDEAGDSWKPLSPKYLAYGRRHPGLSKIRAQAKEKGRASRPLLSESQDKRWRQLYSRKIWELARNLGTGLMAAIPADLKAQAAAYAWMVVKSEGGRTLLGEYGNAPHEIGRDTDRMFASLSPGAEGFVGPGENILRVEPGAIVVGTNVEYAKHFHKRRRLWAPLERWPAQWWQRLAGVAVRAAQAVFAMAVQRAGR